MLALVGFGVLAYWYASFLAWMSWTRMFGLVALYWIVPMMLNVVLWQHNVERIEIAGTKYDQGYGLYGSNTGDLPTLGIAIENYYERPFKAAVALCTIRGPVYLESNGSTYFKSGGADYEFLGVRNLYITALPINRSRSFSLTRNEEPGRSRFLPASDTRSFGKMQPKTGTVYFIPTSPFMIGPRDEIQCTVFESFAELEAKFHKSNPDVSFDAQGAFLLSGGEPAIGWEYQSAKGKGFAASSLTMTSHESSALYAALPPLE